MEQELVPICSCGKGCNCSTDCLCCCSTPKSELNFFVEGMKCGSCVRAIEEALTPFVVETLGNTRDSIVVDLKRSTLTVKISSEHSKTKGTPLITRRILATVKGLGYVCRPTAALNEFITACSAGSEESESDGGEYAEKHALIAKSTTQTRTFEFLVEGMSCASCAAYIEKEVRKKYLDSATNKSSMSDCSVNFATLTATIKFLSSVTSTEVSDVKEFLVSLGYRVKLLTTLAPPTAIPIEFLVEGMSCASCAVHIEKELRAKFVDGVFFKVPPTDCGVYFATSIATLTFTAPPSTADVEIVRSHIESLGFQAKLLNRSNKAKTFEFLVEGMSCASCAAYIEKEVRKKYLDSATNKSSMSDCSVNFATLTATIKFLPSVTSTEVSDVKEFLVSLGYRVKLLNNDAASSSEGCNVPVDGPVDATAETKKALERTQEITTQRNLFVGSLLFTVPLQATMIVSMSSMSAMHTLDSHRGVWLHIVEAVLATPVVVYCGRQFFVRAWNSMRHRSFTMDTLVSIGVGSAFLFSVIALLVTIFTNQVVECYFDAAATLTTFMLLGRFLEATAKRHTSSALIALMNLVPPTTFVVPRDDPTIDDERAEIPNNFVEIPTSQILINDCIRALPGERIATDGVVVRGVGDVDEQMITGESVPRCVRVGDTVTGGTLNVSGTIVYKATRVGSETTLAQILRVVQDAQSTKPSIQRVADRVAGVFVPVVVSFAIVVGLTWIILGAADAYPASWRSDEESYAVFAFNFFISTVVVACPCALGLATPTAIMVGTGVGAAHGVLAKSGVVLEAASKVNCIVFDKTGTLTQGKLEVVACDAFGADKSVAAMTIGALELESTHPIAKATGAYLLRSSDPNLTVSVTEAVTLPGIGMEGLIKVAGKDGVARVVHVAVGSVKMMNPLLWPSKLRPSSVNGVSSLEVNAKVAKLQGEGRTVVVGIVDGAPSVVIGLSDVPKNEARGVVQYLQSEGIRVLMVTGDHCSVAEIVAEQVGIDNGNQKNIFAEAHPEEKAKIVRSLQQEGFKVAFVGDGINDSPALTQADVGIALGAGTEIAIDAADAVLMRSSLEDLCTFFKLAVIVVNRIRINFAWAFAYNLIMLPVASGIFFPLWRYQLSPVFAGMAMVGSSLSVLASSLLLRCFSPFELSTTSCRSREARREPMTREALLAVN